MSQQKNETDVRFWMSRKFWMQVLAAGVFTALAVTETVTFSSQQVLTFVLGLAGIAIGGHVVTDVASLITSVVEGKRTEVARTGTDEQVHEYNVNAILPEMSIEVPMPAVKPAADDRETPIETPRPKPAEEEEDDE